MIENEENNRMKWVAGNVLRLKYGSEVLSDMRIVPPLPTLDERPLEPSLSCSYCFFTPFPPTQYARMESTSNTQRRFLLCNNYPYQDKFPRRQADDDLSSGEEWGGS